MPFYILIQSIPGSCCEVKAVVLHALCWQVGAVCVGGGGEGVDYLLFNSMCKVGVVAAYHCYSLSVYFWSCCTWIMLHIFRQHDIRATQLDALVCWLSWTILECIPLQLHGCCLEVLKGLGRFLSLWQTSSVCLDGLVQRWRYYATVHLFRDLPMSYRCRSSVCWRKYLSVIDYIGKDECYEFMSTKIRCFGRTKNC